MGEAKRRRNAPATGLMLNQMTGEMVTARLAGDPEAFVASCSAGTNASRVPCGGCTECCYHKHVEVYPNQERPEDLPHLSYEADSESASGWRLRTRADGACIHLGEHGCTVYEHRPRACRRYDCRVWSWLGASDTFDGGHSSPAWVFEPRTRHGLALLTAYQFAGMMAMAKFKKDGESWTVHSLIERALPLFHQLHGLMNDTSRLSPEEQAKALGFDPRAMTQEDLMKAQDAMITALGLKETPPSQQTGA
jgi:hypothetical protein